MIAPYGHRWLTEGEPIPTITKYRFYVPATNAWVCPQSDAQVGAPWSSSKHYSVLVRIDGKDFDSDELSTLQPTEESVETKQTRTLRMILTVTHPAHPAYKLAYDALNLK